MERGLIRRTQGRGDLEDLALQRQQSARFASRHVQKNRKYLPITQLETASAGAVRCDKDTRRRGGLRLRRRGGGAGARISSSRTSVMPPRTSAAPAPWTASSRWPSSSQAKTPRTAPRSGRRTTRLSRRASGRRDAGDVRDGRCDQRHAEDRHDPAHLLVEQRHVARVAFVRAARRRRSRPRALLRRRRAAPGHDERR